MSRDAVMGEQVSPYLSRDFADGFPSTTITVRREANTDHAQRSPTGEKSRPTVELESESPKLAKSAWPEPESPLLGIKPRLRAAAYKIATASRFDQGVTLLVFLNCVFLALWQPTKPDDHILNRISNQAEPVFAVLFSLEVIIKVTAHGFYAGKTAYIRDSWNVLDLLVVLLAWVEYTPGMESFLAIRTVRLLRPLRTVSRSPKLRVLVHALLSSIPMLIDVLFLWIFVIIVFSVFGMQFWMGLFHEHCVDPETHLLHTDQGNKVCGGAEGIGKCSENLICSDKDWTGAQLPNPNYGVSSFDNFGWSFIVIFQAMTLEGWVSIYKMTRDSYSGWSLIYWVVLQVFGGFFVVNLATAVMFNQYVKAQEDMQIAKRAQRERSTSPNFRITKDASKRKSFLARYRSFVKDSMVNIFKEPSTSKKWKYQKPIYWLIKHQWFGHTVSVTILLNTVFLAMEHHNMDSKLEELLSIANLIFLVIFTAEAALKVLGLGIIGYLNDNWNMFDGFIVMVSLLEVAAGSMIPSGISALRAFRVLRIIRMVKSARNIRRVIRTLVRSMQEAAHLMIVLSIVLFTFALVGMQFFGGKMCAERACEYPGGVKVGASFREGFNSTNSSRIFSPAFLEVDNDCTQCLQSVVKSYDGDIFSTDVAEKFCLQTGGAWECVAVNRAHFDNVFIALLTAFQLLTGENWHEVMYLAVRETSPLAALYFMSMLLIGNFVLLNLFLAAVVETCSQEMDEMAEEQRKEKQVKADSRRRKSLVDQAAFTRLLRQMTPRTSLINTTPGSTPHRSASGIQLTPRTTPRRFDVTPGTPSPSLELNRPKRDFAKLWKVSMERVVRDPAFLDPCATSPNGSTISLPTLVDDEQLKKLDTDAIVQEPATRVQIPSEKTPVTKPEVVSNRSIATGLEDTPIESKMLRVRLYLWNVLSQYMNPRWVESCLYLGDKSQDAGCDCETRPLSDSLFIFKHTNPLRKVCLAMVNYKHFDNLMVPFILLSSITLAAEDPHAEEETTFGAVLRNLDIVFTAIFAVEMITKVIALGFIFPATACPNKEQAAYLRTGWNRLDVFIVLVSVISLSLDSRSLAALKSMRTLRALRPLRMVSRAEGMRSIINTLVDVSSEITFILVVLLMCMFIFAILGVQLFAGKMFSCTDATRIYEPNYEDVDPGLICVGNWLPPGSQSDTSSEPRVWSSSRPHFNNVIEAMLTLFEMSTMEDWPGIMWKGMDVRGSGVAMGYESQPFYALYFVGYIIFGALFMTNLMIAAVVNQFNSAKDRASGSLYLSEAQHEWVISMSTLLGEHPIKTPPPPEAVAWISRRCAYRLVMHRSFEPCIMALVVLNVVVMMTDHNDSSDAFDLATYVINAFFTGCFVVEMLLKLHAFGLKVYWQDVWNRFDFVVVNCSLFGMGASMLGSNLLNPSLIRVFRMFRATRILRVVRNCKGLRMLLGTFITSLPSIFNVGSVLSLIFFIFATLGKNLFGTADRGGSIDDMANFENFGNAVFTLFRTVTGEDWSSIMNEYLNQNYFLAAPFFIVFLLLVYFVMLNLFVSIILKNFSDQSRLETSKVTPTDFEEFAKAWARVDPIGTSFIRSDKVQFILKDLDPPLGLKGKAYNRREMQQFILDLNMDVTQPGDRLYFHTLLKALASRVNGAELPEQILEGMFSSRIQQVFPPHVFGEGLTCTWNEFQAAIKLQALWKGHVARRKVRQHLKTVMSRAARLSFCTQAVSQAGSRGSSSTGLADAGGSKDDDGPWRPRGAGLLAAAALLQPTPTTRAPPLDNTDESREELQGCVSTSTKRWDTDTQVAQAGNAMPKGDDRGRSASLSIEGDVEVTASLDDCDDVIDELLLTSCGSVVLEAALHPALDESSRSSQPESAQVELSRMSQLGSTRSDSKSSLFETTEPSRRETYQTQDRSRSQVKDSSAREVAVDESQRRITTDETSPRTASGSIGLDVRVEPESTMLTPQRPSTGDDKPPLDGANSKPSQDGRHSDDPFALPEHTPLYSPPCRTPMPDANNWKDPLAGEMTP